MKQFIVILFCGLIGWALCGAIKFVGMVVISLQTMLIVHVIDPPLIFGVITDFPFDISDSLFEGLSPLRFMIKKVVDAVI